MAATLLRHRRQRERILRTIAIRTASSFLPQTNIGHLYFILISISVGRHKLKPIKTTKTYVTQWLVNSNRSESTWRVRHWRPGMFCRLTIALPSSLKPGPISRVDR
jgi:hypothetical protein